MPFGAGHRIAGPCVCVYNTLFYFPLLKAASSHLEFFCPVVVVVVAVKGEWKWAEIIFISHVCASVTEVVSVFKVNIGKNRAKPAASSWPKSFRPSGFQTLARHDCAVVFDLPRGKDDWIVGKSVASQK